MELNDQGIPTLKAARRYGLRLYAGAFGMQALTTLLITISLLYDSWHMSSWIYRNDRTFVEEMTTRDAPVGMMLAGIIACIAYVLVAAPMGRWAGKDILHKGRSWAWAPIYVLPAAIVANVVGFLLIREWEPRLWQELMREEEMLFGVFAILCMGMVTLPGMVIGTFSGLWLRFKRREALEQAHWVPLDEQEQHLDNWKLPARSGLRLRLAIMCLTAFTVVIWLVPSQGMVRVEDAQRHSSAPSFLPYILGAMAFLLTTLALAWAIGRNRQSLPIFPILSLAAPVAAIVVRFMEIQTDDYLYLMWKVNLYERLWLPALNHLAAYGLAIVVPGILGTVAARILLKSEVQPSVELAS